MGGIEKAEKKEKNRLAVRSVGDFFYVCVCDSHPALNVGVLLLEASEGLLSHSQSIGCQFSVTDRATKWEQF